MTTILSSRRDHYLARFSIFLIAVALIAGTVGCPPPTQYDLIISSTAGGSVGFPGEGTSTWGEGDEVSLVAEAEEGYQFVKWTGDVATVANINAASTTITMQSDYSITANFEALRSQADYGDAPDDTLDRGNVFAYPGVVAKFASLYDTGNSRVLGRKGAHNVEPFEAWLSNASNTLSTTKEDDTKLADADEDDAEPMLYIDNTTNDGFIVVRVVVAPTAPDVVRYINVLIDQNRDGEWRNEPDNPEWVGINHPVRVPPGEARNVIIGPIPLRSDFTLPVWTRISLADDWIDHEEFDTYVGEETFFDKNGWDGSAPSGGFSGGETEDWLFGNSGDVPATNLTAVWAGGAGAPPPVALNQTKLSKAIPDPKERNWGITYRWYNNVFPADEEWHEFRVDITNTGRDVYVKGVTISLHKVPSWWTAANPVDPLASISFRKPDFGAGVLIKRGETKTFWIEQMWDLPMITEDQKKIWKDQIFPKITWCPNRGRWVVWYDFDFEFDPPGDPYVDEIESLNEPPAVSVSFSDPEYDLIYTDTGEPVPDEEYLPYMDLVECEAGRTHDTLEFRTTVNGGIPPLEQLTYWAVLMDEDNDPEDNDYYYLFEDTDTMYYIHYQPTCEMCEMGELSVGKAVYDAIENQWITMGTNATWGTIPLPDNRTTITILIPLTELPELGEILPWKVVTETADGTGDLGPDEGLAYLAAEG